MFLLATCLFCLLNCVIGDAETSPRIVIVGAGASGIAAASKLYENGFNNVLILEAEDRIGGRVNTVQFGDYLVDLGAQWVHGQVNNVAYELAEPLGLLENTTWQAKLYDSSGNTIDDKIHQEGVSVLESVFHSNGSDPTGTTGEYAEKQFAEYFKDHPEINETLQKQILRYFNLASCSLSAADSWYQTSLKGDLEYEDCEGNLSINWKEKGYSTVLDILMKKIPDPSKELPVMNNTLLNKEVANIDYTGDNVKIRTVDGQEYLADHVIVTTSLGVLKKDHESLFNPPLSESKINTIKGLAFGTACKIIMRFDEPWWENNLKSHTVSLNLLYNETYLNELEKDENKKWVTDMFVLSAVEHKPHLLLGWVTPIGCRIVETLPDDLVLEQLTDVIHTFLGKEYNVTKPSAMIRSKWTNNKHFRGTYSFRSVESENVNASSNVLAEPIMKNETPVILFAGEATNKGHYSTVHGAIETGWREASRLIKLYAKAT